MMKRFESVLGIVFLFNVLLLYLDKITNLANFLLLFFGFMNKNSYLIFYILEKKNVLNKLF